MNAETYWMPRFERSAFPGATSNKQLNFVRHIKTLVKPRGRAAMVVPDTVLIEGRAGAVSVDCG